MSKVTIPRPMLACNEVVEDLDSITYPVIASVKLDGWRSFNFNGQPITRSGKLIPNRHTRHVLSLAELEGLDGELICGNPADPNAMQKAQSAFSTIEGAPDFTWYIFDDLKRGENGYYPWWAENVSRAQSRLPSFCKIVPQYKILNSKGLDNFTQAMLADGYEGVITRQPNSPYKHNRSTRKQEWMLKVKPWTYEEAVILDLKEKKHNLNAATKSELGFTKRSSHQDGKVRAETLGSFILRSPNYQTEFSVGCGHLDDATKQLIWNSKEQYIGQTVTFRHFKQTGVVKAPRQGQFVSLRTEEDMA